MAGMITSTETTLHPVSQALPPHQPPPLVRPLNGSGGDAGTTVSGPPNASRLTIDDISKHFNVPIAEAATALGIAIFFGVFMIIFFRSIVVVCGHV